MNNQHIPIQHTIDGLSEARDASARLKDAYRLTGAKRMLDYLLDAPELDDNARKQVREAAAKYSERSMER